MANYGLLAGLGRGLSQGAELLNRGMAEDRAVERERQREESIAKRWARQEAREDARNKVADDRYAESLKVQAADKQQAQSNWQKSYSLQERQMTAQEEARRVQRIEETLGRIQSKFDRDAEKIDRKYDRLLDKAETPEEKAALHEQRDREHEALGTKLNAEMLPALKSFGDGLKGTAYATYIDELADADSKAQDEKGRKFLQDAGVVDDQGNFVNQPGPSTGSGRAAKVQQIINDNSTVTPNPAQPSIQPHQLQPGLKGGFAYGSGGFYQNPFEKPNWGAMSPAEKATTFVAGGAGAVPGLLRDAVEIGKDYMFDPVAQWSTTRPTNQGRK